MVTDFCALFDHEHAGGVETPRGKVYAIKVMQAVAGSTSVVAKMAGFRLPIRTMAGGTSPRKCADLTIRPIQARCGRDHREAKGG